MIKRLTAVLAVLVLLVLAPAARAVTPIQPERACSLALTYAGEDMPLSGVPVRLYRVAEVFADGTYALWGDFAEYPVNIYGITEQSVWQQAAQTLSAYAAADGLAPTAQAQTGEDGVAAFSELATGMYLVCGGRVENAAGTFQFAPALLSLPEQGEPHSYAVEARPKCTEFIPAPEPLEHKVVKLWKGGAMTQSVTVELLKDGQTVDTVALSAENNWCYTWSAPDDGSIWQAVERDVPEGFTVSAVTQGNTVVLTNTAISVGGDSRPGTGDPVAVWPYVAAMALSGMLLLILAVGRRRGVL